jgi:Transcriptional regulator/sugar kinase
MHNLTRAGYNPNTMPAIEPALTSANSILGLNLDGERLLIVYGSPSGMVQERLSVSTPASRSFPAILELITASADRLLMITKAQHLPLPDCVSVSITGNYDPLSGILESSPDFPEWKSEPLKSQLGLRFNLPVFIEQHPTAGLLAEMLFGSTETSGTQMYLSFNPTLRTSLSLNGVIFQSPGGSAGDIGKIFTRDMPDTRLNRPLTLNDHLSLSGLASQALRNQSSHWDLNTTGGQVIQAAAEGDPYAIELIEGAAKMLGENLAPLIHLLRPKQITIAYPVSMAAANFLSPLRAAAAAASGLGGLELPQFGASQFGHRQPELEALAPAISALRLRARSR